MLALQTYASSDDEVSSEEQETSETTDTESQKFPETSKCEAMEPYKPPENSEFSVKNQLQVCAAPLVVPTVSVSHYILNKK